MRNRSFTLVGLACAAALCVRAADARIIAVVPADGEAYLVKAFDVSAGTRVTGVEFESNDPTTVFPTVVVLRGASADGLETGEILRSAASVGPGADGVAVTWDPPIEITDDTRLLVAVRMPASGSRSMPGSGPGLGAADAARARDSFVAPRWDEPLVPLQADLAIQLVTGTPRSEAKVGHEFDRDARDGTAPDMRLDVRTRTDGTVTIGFEQGEAGDVAIVVHDARGRVVTTVWEGRLPAGRHEFACGSCSDAGRVARSVYFVTATAGGHRASRKLIVR